MADWPLACPVCEGRGSVAILQYTCARCEGEGVRSERRCATCRGRGGFGVSRLAVVLGCDRRTIHRLEMLRDVSFRASLRVLDGLFARGYCA